jgi:transposase
MSIELPEAEERRTQAIVLYLRCVEQRAIAATLGVAESTVSAWLSGYKRELKERAAEDRLQQILVAMAKLDLVEQHLWAGCQWKLLLKCIDIRLRVLGAFDTQDMRRLLGREREIGRKGSELRGEDVAGIIDRLKRTLK